MPCLAALALAAAAAASAAPGAPPPPEPPTLTSETGDLGRYLGYYKAQALARSRARAVTATANQLQYDVHYYDLDLRLDPLTQVLTGSVRMLASVVNGPMSTLDLDLGSGMTVDAATVSAAPALFTQGGDVLTMQLDHIYSAGQTVDVRVQYHGSPQQTGFGSFTFTTHNGLPMVWTLSEPFGAHQWWPCKDQPDDKADSVDVRVTVPSGMITASNGVRVESSDDGIVAFSHWRERYPIASYLVSVTSFAYTTAVDSYQPASGPSMPLQYFVFPEDAASFAATDAKVPAMLAAYAARFGEYPFVAEKYGHAQFPWGGGMEHQTCTSLVAASEYLVAHEMSHQWWGDMVTCRDFHHVWLNEGFASYSELLWAESQGGADAYRQKLDASRYYGAGTIYVPDLSDVNRIFDGNLSYSKPVWVLHMLRHLLGDAVFFGALREYRRQHEYGVATTEDFEQVCEALSGRDLSSFFQQWIYGEYYPYYRLVWQSSPATGGGYDVWVQLQQIQSWQIFTLPIELRLSGAGWQTTFVLPDSLPLQVFNLHVSQPPTAVALDPDEWILRQIATPVAVAGEPSAAGLALAPPAPNPCRGGAELGFRLPRRGVARLAVLDVSGRRVAELAAGELAAGEHRAAWDARDAAGRPAASGIYWATLEFEGERRTARLVLVR